jgi:hypothetical protein
VEKVLKNHFLTNSTEFSPRKKCTKNWPLVFGIKRCQRNRLIWIEQSRDNNKNVYFNASLTSKSSELGTRQQFDHVATIIGRGDSRSNLLVKADSSIFQYRKKSKLSGCEKNLGMVTRVVQAYAVAQVVVEVHDRRQLQKSIRSTTE